MTFLERLQETAAWRPILYVAILVLAAGLIMVALVVPNPVNAASVSLDVGDVAPQDIRAPSAITFQSGVLTEQQRDAAAASISPVYNPPDSRIARQQVERLRSALTFISNVRQDQFASREQKLEDLSALEDIQIKTETANSILELSDARWQVVQQEAIAVLEQVMRSTIRDYQLEDARRSVPALVSLSLPENQASIVAELVTAFVTPNSLYNEDLTDAARAEARESVAPVTRSFLQGETIVERGRVITPADLEALERAGLLQTQSRWQDIVGAAVLVFLALSFIVFYLRFQPRMARDFRSLGVTVLLSIVFLYAARLTIPNQSVIPYLFPIPAFGLLLATLFGTQYGIVLSIPLSLLVTYDLPNGQELSIYYLMGSLLGVLMLGRGKRIAYFIWAGIAITAGSAGTMIAYRLPDPGSDWIGLATLSGAAALNGISSASLAVLLQFFLAQLLGLTTALQLLDISRPDQPLLQFVLRNAPGTYQHSLQVSNLAEQAAERIDADALLTRVGALYHDAGKAMNPHFFIENQVPGFLNPHDNLDQRESAEIIIRHVTDGLELARKYRLPRRIHDFIAEHHGTLVTRYQYVQAVKAAGGDKSKVDIEDFRYPGPRPRSRETALVMLADGCEARVRAERPSSEAELVAMIKSTIDSRMAEGQLDDTSLTTKDLKTVVDVFATTLRGVYHPRIEYPTMEKRDHPKVSVERFKEGDVPAATQDSLPQTDAGAPASD
jgi:putative nucleotidyltransferase with HDIG domain